MWVIGLTGGIASGKSTAARMLSELGAAVVDADEIARALTGPGGAAADAVMKRFGTLDRRALAARIFADEQERRALNAMVHPLVRRAMQEAVAALDAPAAVLDVPLLFEAGMDDLCDEIWVVHVPTDVQLARVMERDGLAREAALARIRSQMPTEEKLRRADCAIDTSGPLEQTQARLRALWTRALLHAKENV
ncbi:MAG: dephospho-CoA kinase [Christensenellales bacterium]|uniref:Dephospho-CoA kinase n=1 Tax=Candidatus Avichristensenella intestinipullorum TaxID=2840693 RepID=A0A9D1CIX6_9FIRM|nr:dephospho-CoA kinase [Christensenellales bacterium]HIQ63142.1 dephospho-CoA kinase [Candidatus Avichristensenella intestinipullorum]